uniref:Uncharacterized protein n=1 Tax=Rhizophora mucronata TaxID=61149 RepID=A0A2P2NG09_RHIMU
MQVNKPFSSVDSVDSPELTILSAFLMVLANSELHSML